MTHASDPNPFRRPRSLEQLLHDARQRVEVKEIELDETRRRRKLIDTALREEFPGSRIYYNGSIAHGDALTPLGDVDLGVVVFEAVDSHGPGKKGPANLQERAANAIRKALKNEFPSVVVEWRDRKRSILVKFASPVSRFTQDFTADVIVAIENTGAEGLYIPRFSYWDRAHPEEHTRLVRNAIDNTEVAFARIVRLLKHWNRSNSAPLCSWNVKALALGCITEPMEMVDGLSQWFDYSISELENGLTEDPAGVAEKPIKLNADMTRTEVLNSLREARGRLERAVALQTAGYPLQAHEQLARMFNDPEMLPYPEEAAVRKEVDRKYAADLAQEKASREAEAARRAGSKPGRAVLGTPAFVANVGVGDGKPGVSSRSWAP